MIRHSAAALWLTAAVATTVPLTAGCFPSEGAVSLEVAHGPKTPPDAAVFIDEQYVGPLGYVTARGVRLPVGEHRITIEKEGYFPYDQLVEADRQPIHLDVELVPIPD